MASAAYEVSGPTKIIELDGKERSSWRIEENALHLWEGKLWRKEAVGCVLCVEEEGVDHMTFSRSEIEKEDSDEPKCSEHFHCMHHGPLEEVPYEMVKKYTITIGGVVREGEESVRDSMLFPASLDSKERTVLIEKLLDESDSDEKAAGPAPEDESDED
jgi:hypothetical protein